LRLFYRGLTRQLEVKRVPRLLLTEAIESPAVVGLVRGVALLPLWLVAHPVRKRLEWSLKHELMHWRRGDPLAILVRDLALVFFFFHPLAWLAARRLVASIERACDGALLHGPDDAVAYASQLYAILRRIRTRRHEALHGGLFATRTQVGMRIRVLLKGSEELVRPLTPRLAVGLVTLVALVLLVGTGVREHEQPRTVRPVVASKENEPPARAFHAQLRGHRGPSRGQIDEATAD
jgi:beta-lactamase regulating signal transducer with metallopeptidase domain